MMRYRREILLSTAAVLAIGLLAHTDRVKAQTSGEPEKLPPGRIAHILVIGATKGFEHDSIPNSMATIWRMGHDTKLWEATLRTDTELLTKQDLHGMNRKNLNYFDALVFTSPTGNMDLPDVQKHDMLAFIHDDGKGFVGVHAALDSNYNWPEYGEMIGGYFNEHPWMTFNVPIINESPDFPAVRHFPHAFVKRDEIYQAKDWSRDKVNVLLSLDASKLDFNNPRVHRTDHDFAVAWSKMYGNGRVFYSTLGHTTESWDDPDITKMYFEAIRWVLHMTDGSTASHPKTGV